MDFESDNEIGMIGERLMQEYRNLDMKNFEQYPDMQKYGIDATRGAVAVEIKTRRPDIVKYWYNGADMLIETVSVVEHDKPGWIYTSTCDILYYLVLTPDYKSMWHLWRIKFEALQSWFAKQDITKYRKKFGTTDGSHKTENRVVPFSDIPKHIWSKLK